MGIGKGGGFVIGSGFLLVFQIFLISADLPTHVVPPPGGWKMYGNPPVGGGKNTGCGKGGGVLGVRERANRAYTSSCTPPPGIGMLYVCYVKYRVLPLGPQYTLIDRGGVEMGQGVLLFILGGGGGEKGEND